MGDARAIGTQYRERITLRDGSVALLRPIRPDDKRQLVSEFERLSPLSRYRRFHGAKARLSDAELKYLTEVDFEDHVALVAGHETNGTPDEGYGVARFIRTPGAEWAEAAITVADAHQGKGLGRALLERLVLAARERGIVRFRFDVLGSNGPMLAMVRDLAPSATLHPDGPVVHVEVPLPKSGERDAEVYRLLSLSRPGDTRE